jgi:hypothetical protein
MQALFDQIYEKGDGEDHGLTLDNIASNEPIAEFMLNLLDSLTIRSDFNGRPRARRDPVSKKTILRTHPFYYSKPDHYGRVYEYRLILEEEVGGMVSPNFYACVYDLPAGGWVTGDFVNALAIANGTYEGPKIPIVWDSTPASIAASTPEERRRIEDQECLEKMRQGDIARGAFGLARVGSQWYLLSKSGMVDESD